MTHEYNLQTAVWKLTHSRKSGRICTHGTCGMDSKASSIYSGKLKVMIVIYFILPDLYGYI